MDMASLTTDDIAHIIRETHDGRIDPEENAKERFDSFCWITDYPFAAQLVAQFAIPHYSDHYDIDNLDVLADHVLADRFADLENGAEPTAEELMIFGIEARRQEFEQGCLDYSSGYLYRLVAPEPSTETRVVWFLEFLHPLYGKSYEPAGPFPSLDLIFKYVEHFEPDFWEAEIEFPEQDTLARFNAVRFKPKPAFYWSKADELRLEGNVEDTGATE